MSTATVEVSRLPSLPVHALKPLHSSSPSQDNTEPNQITRSASYTSLPGVIENSATIKRTFSDNVLSSLAQAPTKVSASVQNANVEMFRRASQKTKKRMSVAGFVSVSELKPPERVGRNMDNFDAASVKSGRSFKMFSRKAWMTSSRPQSPSRTDDSKIEPKRTTSPSKRDPKRDSQGIAIPEPVVTRRSPRTSHNPDGAADTRPQDAALSRKNNVSPSPVSREASEYNPDIDSETSSKMLSTRTSFTSLRSRPSLDKMYLKVPGAKVPPMPPSVSSDRLSALSNDSTHRRDPYWTIFRNLDGEHASFGSKASLQKAKVVRTVVLPFLSKTNDRASANALRAEELDRRVVILNKWWLALLELLNGTGQQAISGTDRPAFLEAICEIMFRQEWKIPSHHNSESEAASSDQSTLQTDSNSSVDSDESDFLIRTVHQNIRNMFVQNITQQMAYVVDKLSMRAAPASLVIFGGKTCAYAFFYCPGVADILVRLWRIPPGTLRRILSEYGPDCSRKVGMMSHSLAASFPTPLKSLCFTSQTALARQLQSKIQVPPGTTHIRWYGPWVNRWSGRDSDLFFVFVKHYHILVAHHLPRHLLAEERMGLPGFAIVHAQILMNLESALYRQAGNFAAEHYSHTSDNPDAMAPMPMIIPNATRSIGENRLVMLMRDCIGAKRPENAALAELLVGPFQFVLKAAVRKVSMFNNDACFVLCDFLEELVPLVTKYQRVHVEEEDWAFWLNVYKQLMKSQSSMTQIRVIAFLYSTWPLLITNEQRKRQVVLEWMLNSDFFSQYFCHWSPMVRHYFYRLLCWRIGRSNGPASEVDLEIYQQLHKLLTQNWARHQYLTADAEMRDTAPPSTNPCAPAPGRALLIIRTDTQNRPVDFTSFDKLMPNTGGNNFGPYASLSALTKVPSADKQETGASNAPKKRWSILKTMSLFSGPPNSRPGEVTPPSSPDSNTPKPTNEPLSRPSTPPPQNITFKFTLEFTNNRPSMPKQARRLPLPTLPHTSQKLLDDLRKLEGLSSRETLVQAEVKPLKPKPHEMQSARYAGRALSEWALVVQECRGFYVRRKQEGVKSDDAVEIPHIAVESFRMFG